MVPESSFNEGEEELTCGRHGCKKKYFEKDNVDNICQFHPGPPIFHEGYKGWKCCGRKTVDFDEYLTFVGCAYGKHKPADEQAKTTFGRITNTPTTTNNNSNVKVVSKEGGVEVYGSAPSTNVKKPLPKPEPEPEPEKPSENKKNEIPDPPDAVIPFGAPCNHQGCKETYKDDSSRTELCVYHPGSPIFHEGSKGWDCCRKLTLIFDEFMNQEGCTDGVHKFIPDIKPVTVNVRNDFYQSGDNITLTFYAKNCDKSLSSITFSPSTISVNLKLGTGEVYTNQFKLSGGKKLDDKTANFSILSTRVEVKFKKATEGDWTKLF